MEVGPEKPRRKQHRRQHKPRTAQQETEDPAAAPLIEKLQLRLAVLRDALQGGQFLFPHTGAQGTGVQALRILQEDPLPGALIQDPLRKGAAQLQALGEIQKQLPFFFQLRHPLSV